MSEPEATSSSTTTAATDGTTTADGTPTLWVPPSATNTTPLTSTARINMHWVQDDKVHECFACANSFGIFNRKHHCRSCGLIVDARCSKFKAKLPAFADDLVRVCVECQCSIYSSQRGISVPRIRKFIDQSLNPSNTNTTNKLYLHGKLQEIQKLIAEQEQKLFKSGSSEQEVAEFKEKMLKMAADAETIQSDLTKLRLNNAIVATIILTPKTSLSELNVLHHRLLVICPNPRLIAISSLIYPTPSNPDKDQTQLRFRLIRCVDEIQSFKPVEFTLPGKQIGRGINITWTPASEVNPAAKKAAEIKLHQTQFILIDIEQQETVKKVQEYLKKIESKDGSNTTSTTDNTDPNNPNQNKRGSMILRNEHYDAKLRETIQQNLDSAKLKVKEADALWNLQSEVLQTFHAHNKDHALGVKIQMKLIEKYYKDMHTIVDWNNEEHANLLKRLWISYSGENSEFPGQKSEKWKDLGFQGENPQTDFRGTGLLGLTMLVYTGEKYTADMRRLVNLQSQREYPLCTAGINLVNLIGEFLTLTKPEGYDKPLNKIPLFRVFCRHASEASESCFGELLSNLLPLLDHLWVLTSANYMQFPQLLATLKERIQLALNDNPASFAVLLKILNQEDLDAEEPLQFMITNTLISPQIITLPEGRLSVLKNPNGTPVTSAENMEKSKSKKTKLKKTGSLEKLNEEPSNANKDNNSTTESTATVAISVTTTESKESTSANSANKTSTTPKVGLLDVSSLDKLPILAHRASHATAGPRILASRIEVDETITETDDDD